jgi:hypothetical protein
VTLTGDYPGVVDNPQIDIVDPDGYDNFLAKIHYDAGTGRVYDDNELIIDPAKGAQVGAFTAFDTTTVGGPFWQNFSLAVPDSSLNLVFILGRTYAQQISGSDDYTIESWNQKTQTLVNTITLPNVVGIPVGFIRWGASGLAIVTYDDQELPDHGPPGMLYIVNNPAFVTAAAASTPGEGKVGP